MQDFGIMHRAVRQRDDFGGMKKMQDKGQSPFRRHARPLRRAKPTVEPVVKFEKRSQSMKNKKSWGSTPEIPKGNGLTKPNSEGSERRKFALYIDEDTLAEVGNKFAENGFGSRSEFIVEATKFYLGYLSAKSSVKYLLPVMNSIIRDQMQVSEQRTNRNLFKIAVELGKLSHILAAISDVDDDTVRELHAMIVDEVRRINGIINFESAERFQHDDF